MPGKALLIAVGIDGLVGTEADIAAMGKALGAFGIDDVKTCVGAAATRDGILAAYRALIDAVEPGDTAVVYYTGHGGRVPGPRSGDGGPDLMDLQFIAPYDFHDWTPEDFRGISSVELSVLLAELSAKTANATIVLDCCYSGLISRDGLRPKALIHETPYEVLQDHIERLSQAGQLDTSRFKTGGNPDAVRIVACEPYQSAFEYTGRDGKPIGLLTEALTAALAAAGTEPVTWATVIDAVRRQVIQNTPAQRPDVEGPAHRLVFSTEIGDLLDTLPVSVLDNGKARIECAPLLGVQAGDEFMVMPPGAAVADPAKKVGDLLVDAVGPVAADGPVTFAAGWTAVPLGARAFRTKVTAPTIPVTVPDTGPGAADVTQAIVAAPLLRPAGPDDSAMAEVIIDADGRLTLRDRVGPLHAPRPAGPEGVTQAVRDLTAMAQATALRNLAGSARWALGANAKVEWGTVVGGAKSPLPPHGATIRVGDSIYVSVVNPGPMDVYVSIVDIGVSGRISVLTSAEYGGHRVGAGQEWICGYEEWDRKLVGMGMFWPEGLDPDAARLETLLVLVMSDPQDVTPLERPGVSRSMAAPDTSPLEQLIDQLATGASRDVGKLAGPPVRYDVHTIDFELGGTTA